MGSALYSRPDAAVRELIQNAHDAVIRRRKRELSYQGRIDIRQDAEQNVIEFHDDGFGLSADDAEQYLGTLGIGLTGLLKGKDLSANKSNGDTDLIGMFGIGLFSGFMLCDRMVVESRRAGEDAVRWSAGGETEIELSSCDREATGTMVRLHLKPQFRQMAEDVDLIEKIVKEYADFLSVPVFLNDAQARANIIHTSWFDPTPDREAIELELATYFDESPLDVIPVQISQPTSISGALYVTPQRTPGFSDEATVTATVLRMVISRNIRDLLPDWAPFLRGVLELRSCSPTASREDLVRDSQFELARVALETHLLEHFERLAKEDPGRLESILSWHRYTWAGAALVESRVRALLRHTYKFTTSKGTLTFDDILRQSTADPIFEAEFDRVVWYNTDRRQEGWINSLFADHTAPCVHTLRSFEESLLAAMVGDSSSEAQVDLRFASPSSPGFAAEILAVDDLEEAPKDWQDYLADNEADIQCASFRSDVPVMSFLNERHELLRTFEELKKQGVVPSGFQRLIDAHFDEHESARNEVLLNRNHRLVARALEQKTNSPLASVLRLLVTNSLVAAGASVPNAARRQQADDLDWIAECLWGQT
jgi:HSP90 family molecular chaperone